MAFRQAMCRFAAKGSKSSTVFSRNFEVKTPFALPYITNPATKLCQGPYHMPPRPPASRLPSTHSTPAIYLKSAPVSKSMSANPNFAYGVSMTPKSVITSVKEGAQDFIRSKFGTNGTSDLQHTIVKKFVKEFLESFWTTSIQKIGKHLHRAVFWAASAVFFFLFKQSKDEAKALDEKAKVEQEEEEKDCSAQTIQVVMDELRKHTTEQNEKLRSLEEKNAKELQQLRKDLSTIMIISKVCEVKNAPKMLDVSAIRCLDPDKYLPRLPLPRQEDE